MKEEYRERVGEKRGGRKSEVVRERKGREERYAFGAVMKTGLKKERGNLDSQLFKHVSSRAERPEDASKGTKETW